MSVFARTRRQTEAITAPPDTDPATTAAESPLFPGQVPKAEPAITTGFLSDPAESGANRLSTSEEQDVSERLAAVPTELRSPELVSAYLEAAKRAAMTRQ